jgi:hypothetical protein
VVAQGGARNGATRAGGQGDQPQPARTRSAGSRSRTCAGAFT